jgi:hypothetical protein
MSNINKEIMKSIFKTVIVLLFLGAFELNAQNTSEPPKVAVKISNEKQVNTARLEFSPTFYEDGIIFVSSNNDVTKKKTVDANQTLMMSILRSRRGGNFLKGDYFHEPRWPRLLRQNGGNHVLFQQRCG